MPGLLLQHLPIQTLLSTHQHLTHTPLVHHQTAYPIISMPKAASSTQSDVDTKPYVRPEGETTLPPPKQKKASGSPTKKGPGSPSKAQGWSLEDKQTLLLAVLATAKPDFASIARDKFPTRNANQAS